MFPLVRRGPAPFPEVRVQSVLVVDDEMVMRGMLTGYLGDRYDVKSVGCAKDAMDLCRRDRFDLVICDIKLPDIEGPDLLTEIRNLQPEVKCLLITGHNVDDYVMAAQKCGVSNIIAKTVPFDYRELDTAVSGLLTEEIFGLRRHLLDDATILEEYCIRSSIEAKQVRDDIDALITERLGRCGDVRLIIDELITNAVYHAPATDGGAEKYPEYSRVDLQPDEYVYVAVGHDLEKYGVSVTDQQGRLRKETVLNKIGRHVKGEGMLDESGRGIHMSRLFADRMIVNIEPGVKTEIIFLNHISPRHIGYKSLYINEL